MDSRMKKVFPKGPQVVNKRGKNMKEMLCRAMQGSRKLELLEPSVPDKTHLIGQNDFWMKKYWTYYDKRKGILSYSE